MSKVRVSAGNIGNLTGHQSELYTIVIDDMLTVWFARPSHDSASWVIYQI